MKTTIILMIFGVIVTCLAIASLAEKYSTPLNTRLGIFIAKVRGAVKSKTIWFNAAALLFVQQLPSLVDYLAQNAPVLQPFIPADKYQFVIGAIAIANVILRFKTANPLEAK